MSEQQPQQQHSFGKRVADGVKHIQEFTISNTLKLSPVLIAATIFATATWFFSATAGEDRLQVMFNSEQLQDSIRVLVERDTTLLMHAQSSRITWAMLGNIHLLACMGAFFVGVWILRKNWKQYTLSQQIRLALLVLATVAFTLWLFLNQRDVQQLGTGLLLLTSKAASRRFLEMVYYFDALSLVSAALLAVTSCALLMLPPRSAKRLTSSDLLHRMSHQRLILYGAAAVLVTGVMHTSALFHLAQSYIPESIGALSTESHTLINSLINSRAIYYTLVLGGIYLPGTLYLQNELKAVPEKHDEAAVTNELTWTPLGLLPRLLAILAPLFSGPVLELIKAVIGVE